MTHEKTLDEHLRAIAERDLAAYTATLHEDVTLILPTGARREGREAVTDFHRDFFADHDWTQDFRPVRTIATPGAVTAVYDVDYRDVDMAGAPIRKNFLVSLVFVRADGQWLLFHDQCTPLPDA